MIEVGSVRNVSLTYDGFISIVIGILSYVSEPEDTGHFVLNKTFENA